MIGTRRKYRKHRKGNKKRHNTRRKNAKRRVSRRHRKRSNKKHRRRSRRSRKYKGGGCGKSALVGKPWNGGDTSTWGKSNHYALHDGKYPQYGMHSSHDGVPLEQTGGGITDIIPRDLMNLGRSVKGGVYDLYAGYRGVPPSTSPLPSKDQPIDQKTKYIGGLPVDMTHRLREADDVVASI